MKRLNYKYFKGFHHFYLGIIVLMLGFIAVFTASSFLSIMLYLLGIYILSDDYYQHMRQRWDKDYHSPLHRFYVRCFKNKFILACNRFLDKIFGK